MHGKAPEPIIVQELSQSGPDPPDLDPGDTNESQTQSDSLSDVRLNHRSGGLAHQCHWCIRSYFMMHRHSHCSITMQPVKPLHACLLQLVAALLMMRFEGQASVGNNPVVHIRSAAKPKRDHTHAFAHLRTGARAQHDGSACACFGLVHGKRTADFQTHGLRYNGVRLRRAARRLHACKCGSCIRHSEGMSLSVLHCRASGPVTDIPADACGCKT